MSTDGLADQLKKLSIQFLGFGRNWSLAALSPLEVSMDSTETRLKITLPLTTAAAVSVSMRKTACKPVAVLLLYNRNVSRSDSPNIDVVMFKCD